MQARLDRLSNALERRQQQSANEAGGEAQRQSFAAANLGLRALIEFVTAIVVAPLIGWQIDTWLKTGPIFLIIFLMLGMAAGLLNVYRIAVGPTGPREPK
ncbi:MAG TPA: AtpZ/AtpI family protein [Methylovirgula sp.]|nr:AtpZ/AtpI family protein [Methylovirgula sp.]